MDDALPFVPPEHHLHHRGLAQAGTAAPVLAHPPALTKDMALARIARKSLREAFFQFRTNLFALLSSDEPELLHQARVGWRRLRCMLWFFRPLWHKRGAPDLSALDTLLEVLTQLRDLDVAAVEVLPAHASAFALTGTGREKLWHHFAMLLAQQSCDLRASVHCLLNAPETGEALTQIAHWIDRVDRTVQRCQPERGRHGHALGHKWIAMRTRQIADQFLAEPARPGDPARQHARRIAAKRLRYCVETFKGLLPARQAGRWLQLALHEQTQIGALRDVQQAVHLAVMLEAPRAVVRFLRDVLAVQTGAHRYEPVEVPGKRIPP